MACLLHPGAPLTTRNYCRDCRRLVDRALYARQKAERTAARLAAGERPDKRFGAAKVNARGVPCACGRPSPPGAWFCSDHCRRACALSACETIVAGLRAKVRKEGVGR